MGKSIVYCDSCGKRLFQEDFDSGRAHVAEDRPYCADCRAIPAPQTSTPRRHTAVSSTGTARVPSSRDTRTRSRPTHAPVWIGAACGIGVIILAVALLSSGGNPAPPRAKPDPTDPPSAPPPSESRKAPVRKPLPRNVPVDQARSIEQRMKAEVESRRKEFVEREREARSTLGHWKLDGAATDSSAARQDGQLSGGPRWTSGRTGGALRFDGVDDGVTISSIEGLSPHAGPDGALTVCLWARIEKRKSGEKDSSGAAVAKGRPGAWEYAIYISPGGGAGLTVWQPGGSNYAAIWRGALTPERWHHVAGVLRKGKFVRIYIDGKLKGESTEFKGDTKAGPSPLYLGRRGDGRFFRGTIDDVRLYGRALTEQELQALVASGR